MSKPDQPPLHAHSRPSTPPFGSSNGGAPQWNWGGPGGDKFGGNSSNSFGSQQHAVHPLFKDSALNSGPPTRRGSMAHILNPAETAERDEEGDDREEEDRKRKRLG